MWPPDTSRLASGSEDNNIIIWDVAGGQPVTTLTGHSNWVTSVAWSPDGSRLASGSSDGKIYILPDGFTQDPCKWFFGRNLSLEVELNLG